MDASIESALLSVKFKNKGAELCSIKSKKTGIEYLWQADPAFWPRHAPILFPVVGKLKNDTYFFKGQSYTLPQHGFARDAEFTVTDQTSSWICFRLTSSDITKKVYPFDFSLQLRYELEGNMLSLTCQVKNSGSSLMLYSVGGHPAFRVPLIENEQRSDYEIRFQTTETVETHVISDGLLTGESTPILHQKNVLPITDHLFEHDALVFKDLKSKKISLAKKNKSPFLNFHFESPFFGIWSKSAEAPFVCLEPWLGIADSTDHDQQLENKEGIRRLAPQAVENFKFSIEILE